MLFEGEPGYGLAPVTSFQPLPQMSDDGSSSSQWEDESDSAIGEDDLVGIKMETDDEDDDEDED